MLSEKNKTQLYVNITKHKQENGTKQNKLLKETTQFGETKQAKQTQLKEVK